MSHNQSGVPTPIPTPASDDLDVVPNAPSVMRRCPDGRVCVGGCAEELCARVEVIDRLRSTEESGEPKPCDHSRCPHSTTSVCCICGDFKPGFQRVPKPAPESADYLRGKLDELKIENDRLQTSNAAMRRRLEDIANQYAVDCL